MPKKLPVKIDTWEPESINIEVVGAGHIEISTECNFGCGGEVGFSFNVSWGRSCGGVISKEEALKLVKHVSRSISLDELTNE